MTNYEQFKRLPNWLKIVLGSVLILIIFLGFNIYQSFKAKSEFAAIDEIKTAKIQELEKLHQSDVKLINQLDNALKIEFKKVEILERENEQLSIDYEQLKIENNKKLERLKLEHEAERQKLIDDSNKIILENFKL